MKHFAIATYTGYSMRWTIRTGVYLKARLINWHIALWSLIGCYHWHWSCNIPIYGICMHLWQIRKSITCSFNTVHDHLLLHLDIIHLENDPILFNRAYVAYSSFRCEIMFGDDDNISLGINWKYMLYCAHNCNVLGSVIQMIIIHTIPVIAL